MHRIFDLQCFFNTALKSEAFIFLAAMMGGLCYLRSDEKCLKTSASERGIETFLEYFHAATMCHLSIPLGQIRLSADQKRIFSHNPDVFSFLFFYSSGANNYRLAF